MLHFRELRYSNNNKSLIIDVTIDNNSYYNNVVLDSIVIDTQDTFIPNGPSSKPIYTYNVSEEYDKVYAIPENCNCNPIRTEDGALCFIQGEIKQVRLEIPLTVLGVDCNTMLFVYAIATGVPAIDTPCGLDNSKIMGTVINLQGIYNNIMGYIRDVENSCEISKGFIDTILRYKALEVCVKTGNYPQAIKYWNKYFKDNKIITPNKSCGCYGNN